MATDLAVQYSFLTALSSGPTVVVAAQPGQRIRVLQLMVITSAPNSVKFQSNSVTDLTALFPLAQNGGFVMPYSDIGWFQTNIGESLAVNMTAGNSTGIQVVWCPYSF
jgi:hypothetical protein